MSELQVAFIAATERAKALPARPDNATLLRLYGLYKQATEGDVSGKRPGFTDVRGRAKYDAWQQLRGTSREGAMQAYIDTVDSLDQPPSGGGSASFGD